MRNRIVCARCGLRVILWHGKTWKHCAGGAVKSCGQKPIVTSEPPKVAP